MNLWNGSVPGDTVRDGFVPYVERWPAGGRRPRGAVIVCPGGGYGTRAEHEGAPVARRWVEQGIHAFVLQYRVAPHRHPEPLMDASRAIRLVRRHAAEWNILPDHVAILGFSAGGHLTASAGTLWEKYDFRGVDDLAPVSNRPDAFAPCYPVISTGPHVHRGSFENLTGAYPPPGGLKEELSLELQVTPRTPPCFLWHTADDDAVPVENSLLFAQACRRQGVPFELVVYPKGHHGLGLAEDNPHVASWSGLCCDWLKQMGW